MSRALIDFDNQLQNLSRGISFMSKEAILMHEIDLQLRIYLLFTIVGAMIILLAILL